MKSPHTHRILRPLLPALLWAAAHAGAEVTLVKDGKAQAVIVVAPEIMAEDKKVTPAQPEAEREAETDRRRLRESVNDLALYLGKISGAKVEIAATAPSAPLVPITV